VTEAYENMLRIKMTAYPFTMLRLPMFHEEGSITFLRNISKHYETKERHIPVIITATVMKISRLNYLIPELIHVHLYTLCEKIIYLYNDNLHYVNDSQPVCPHVSPQNISDRFTFNTEFGVYTKFRRTNLIFIYVGRI
jgi:hypothetical protein